MALFGRRNVTPKKERRKSNNNNGNGTTSIKNGIVATPNQVAKSSPRRSASPFRFRRRDKHHSDETDSDTTSGTIHNNHHQREKQKKNETKKKKSLGVFFKRNSKKGENVKVEENKDKTPKSRSRKSLGMKPSSLDSISNEPKTSFFISSPSARTSPKRQTNRKSKQSFNLENLNSPSSRTHDSMNSNITSSSLLKYPPSKLPTTIYNKKKRNEENLQSDSIHFDIDDGDDESETKSVDTQQYAEYQNVLHQLKAKMLKEKDDEKREFDCINEEDEDYDDDGEKEAHEIIKATFLHRDSSPGQNNNKDNVSRSLSYHNKSKFKLYKKRTLSPLTCFQQ